MKKIIFICISLLCSPGFCGVFSTAGHKKSNGLHIELHYPDGWTAEEGIRPHIVQRFSDNNGNYCQLQIQSIGQDLSQEEWSEIFKNSTAEDWKDLFGSDYNIRLVKHTKYEGLDGVIFKVSEAAERGGTKIYIQGIIHSLGYKDSWIMLWCMSGGLTRQSAEQTFNKKMLEFIQWGNGLVLLDKYL